MQKRRIVFGVFMVAIFGLVIWAGISMASIESKNFYDYFGVAYMPNASEQPQVRFAVLKGLLRLRSQCKELIKQRIKTEIAIEELRESIVNNPKQTDGVSGQRLIGLLKERAGFLEDEKERASLFFVLAG